MIGKVAISLFAAIPFALCGRSNFLDSGWIVAEGECGRDLERLKLGFERNELWALKMLDSSTKLPSGLMTGNLIDNGNYDECLDIVHMKTQHCSASLHQQPQNASAGMPVVYRWSYCIPKSCSSAVLRDILTRAFSMIELNVTVNVSPVDCHYKKALVLSSADILGICIWVGFAMLAISSTIYDVSAILLKTEKNPWLVSFSLYTNARRLLNTEISKGTLTPLNGLRFLSIAWVVLGHRLYFSALSGFMNLLDVFEDFENISFQIFAGGVLAVDTFFLLSGLLNSYLLLNVLDKTKKFSLGKFYIHRYLRLTPVLAAIVLMYSTWFVLLGDGPEWERMTYYWKKLCLDNWWPTLLYINNYYNPVQQCAGQSWYLAVDMQLYWLSPLVILPIWKWPKTGKHYLGLLLFISTITQFLVAFIYEFRMAFSISPDLEESNRVIKLMYVPTHMRATPYIIGVMLGAYLDSIRNQPEKPRWPRVVVIFGWLFSATVCLSVLFGNYPLFRSPEKHPYNKLESSLYICLHRIGWGAGISWVILACLFGYGGIVNRILSWKVFLPLSRLTYCIFLCHMAVQQYQLDTMRTTGYYQKFDEIHRFFGDLFFSVAAAAILSLLFEFPFTVLEKLAFGREKSRENLQSCTNKAFQET